MSNSTAGASRDDSPFTVEDTGSTSDAADLVGAERARQGDAALAGDAAPATAHAVRSSSEAADRFGTDSGTERVTGFADDGVGHVHDGADRVDEVDGTTDHRTERVTSTEPMPEVDGRAERVDDTDLDRDDRANGLSSLVADDDDSISHVFDQTNGVIERADGDSDGTAESDVLSGAERDDGNPDLFHDADVRGSGETGDTRRQGE